MTQFDFRYMLEHGTYINSKGTTGKSKTIFRSPANLKKVVEVGIEAQKITKKSKILTVASMSHAAGLLAQTLPAFALGCEFKIQSFNPYSFFRDFQDYTHTSLIPAYMRALMKTKNFNNCDLSGKWILVGSAPVTWDIIEAFVSKGATVQANWGMSEVGPVTINGVFDKSTDIASYKNKSTGTILGNQYYTEYNVEDGILWVKGDLVYREGWLCTGDLVVSNGGALYYMGRAPSKNADT